MTLRLVALSLLVGCGSPAPAPSTQSTAPAAATPAPASAAAPASADGAPQTEDDKVVYALGLTIGRSLKQFQLQPAEVALVQRGMSDELGGKPAVSLDEYGPKIQELAMARAQAAAKASAESSSAFLKTLSDTAGATVTPSGVVYLETQAGTGASPTPADVVTVQYRGTLADGTVFDSSYDRGQPAQFPLGQVIPCWTEGLQKMKVGGKATLGCPSNTAYGDQGQGDIPPGAALKFEVELLGIGS